MAAECCQLGRPVSTVAMDPKSDWGWIHPGLQRTRPRGRLRQCREQPHKTHDPIANTELKLPLPPFFRAQTHERHS